MTPSYFFRHDYSARMDEKCGVLIARHGFEGYGLFWALVEMMHEHATGRLKLCLLEGTARMLGVDKDALQRVIDTCVEVGLFAKDAEDVYSERVLEQRARVEDIRQKRSEAGRKGGQVKSTSQANARQVPGKEEANPTREEERRENTKNYVGGRRDGQESNAAPSTTTVKVPAADQEPDPWEMGPEFRRLVVECGWGDEHYVAKTWDQGCQLPPPDRKRFFRKVAIVVRDAPRPTTRSFARKVYLEITALVNDKGAMQSPLSPQEKAARDLFREETGQDLSAA